VEGGGRKVTQGEKTSVSLWRKPEGERKRKKEASGGTAGNSGGEENAFIQSILIGVREKSWGNNGKDPVSRQEEIGSRRKKRRERK